MSIQKCSDNTQFGNDSVIAPPPLITLDLSSAHCLSCLAEWSENAQPQLIDQFACRVLVTPWGPTKHRSPNTRQQVEAFFFLSMYLLKYLIRPEIITLSNWSILFVHIGWLTRFISLTFWSLGHLQFGLFFFGMNKLLDNGHCERGGGGGFVLSIVRCG